MGTHPTEIDSTGQEPGSSEASTVPPSYGDGLRDFFPNRRLIPCEVSDWVNLNEGELVVVQRAGMHPKAGVIDTISDDAYVFWVSLEYGEGRIMINAQESVSVWQFPP